MRIDDTDIRIIDSFFQIEQATTSEIAKRIFQISNDYELRVKDNLIRNRLNKLVSFGIIKSEKQVNGNKTYYVDENKCKKLMGDLIFKKGDLELNLIKGSFILIKSNGLFYIIKPPS